MELKNLIPGSVDGKITVKVVERPRLEKKTLKFSVGDHTARVGVYAPNFVAKKFANKIEMDKVYDISRFTVRGVQGGGSDIVLRMDTVLMTNNETVVTVLERKTCSVREVESIEDGTLVDFVGIIQDVEMSETLKSNCGKKDYIKRNLLLKSEDRFITVSLWGARATAIYNIGDSMKVKDAVVKSYLGEKMLSLINRSEVECRKVVFEGSDEKGDIEQLDEPGPSKRRRDDNN